MSSLPETRRSAARASRPFGDRRRYPGSGRRLPLNDGRRLCVNYHGTRRAESGGEERWLSARRTASGQRPQRGRPVPIEPKATRIRKKSNRSCDWPSRLS